MAEDGRDMLMILEMSPGSFVPAECSGVIAPGDPLATGFQGRLVGGQLVHGNYFSIEDFTFEVSIEDKDGKDGMNAQKESATAQLSDHRKQVVKTLDVMNERHQALERRMADRNSYLERRIAELEAIVAGMQGGSRAGSGSRSGGSTSGGGSGGGADGGGGGSSLPSIGEPSGRDTTKFLRFMNEGRAFSRGRGGNYPSDLDEIAITKQMDLSSTTLFDACKKSFKFTSATILKRKAVGGSLLQGYLRMKFYDVMISELNWDDDEDAIKEKFKFVCRRASVQYSVETTGDSKSGGVFTLAPQPEVEWNVLASKSA